MRKLIAFILMFAMMCSMGNALAAISGDAPLVFNTPILVTNAGQGPGGRMSCLLAGQAKTIEQNVDYFYKSEPGRDIPMKDDLSDLPYSCLVVVIGSTDKGLGASGISIDEEVARLEVMVETAKEINLPIVAVLLEKDKRSDIPTNANERCIDVICPAACWMIVVQAGNTDGRFDKLKEEYGIPLTILDTQMDFTALAKEAFVKAA